MDAAQLDETMELIDKVSSQARYVSYDRVPFHQVPDRRVEGYSRLLNQCAKVAEPRTKFLSSVASHPCTPDANTSPDRCPTLAIHTTP